MLLYYIIINVISEKLWWWLNEVHFFLIWSVSAYLIFTNLISVILRPFLSFYKHSNWSKGDMVYTEEVSEI